MRSEDRPVNTKNRNESFILMVHLTNVSRGAIAGADLVEAGIDHIPVLGCGNGTGITNLIIFRLVTQVGACAILNNLHVSGILAYAGALVVCLFTPYLRQRSEGNCSDKQVLHKLSFLMV